MLATVGIESKIELQDGQVPVDGALHSRIEDHRSQWRTDCRLLRRNRPTVLLRAGLAVCHQRPLVLAHAGKYRNQPPISVQRHVEWQHRSASIKRGWAIHLANNF